MKDLALGSKGPGGAPSLPIRTISTSKPLSRASWCSKKQLPFFPIPNASSRHQKGEDVVVVKHASGSNPFVNRIMVSIITFYWYSLRSLCRGLIIPPRWRRKRDLFIHHSFLFSFFSQDYLDSYKWGFIYMLKYYIMFLNYLKSWRNRFRWIFAREKRGFQYHRKVCVTLNTTFWLFVYERALVSHIQEKRYEKDQKTYEKDHKAPKPSWRSLSPQARSNSIKYWP